MNTYHRKVLLSGFHLNGHTWLFHPQTQKLELACTAYIKVLFIMLYKAVLTYEYVDEILKCGHSSESYWVVWDFKFTHS